MQWTVGSRESFLSWSAVCPGLRLLLSHLARFSKRRVLSGNSLRHVHTRHRCEQTQTDGQKPKNGAGAHAQENKQHSQNMNGKKGLILFLVPGPSNLDHARGSCARAFMDRWELILGLVVCPVRPLILLTGYSSSQFAGRSQMRRHAEETDRISLIRGQDRWW